MLFPENIGEKLSIDEVSISKDELYTIVTNKAARGKKGAIVAIVEGIKSANVAFILSKISKSKRKIVKEVTLDMSNCMDAIVRASFEQSIIVIDRFHVQQLVSEAVQEIRIAYRKKAIMEENEIIKKCRSEGKRYVPEFYENGDSKKQLLARSRLLLFSPSSKWSERQRERAQLLFNKYPKIEKAYKLSMSLRACYENSKSIPEAKEKLDSWYRQVEKAEIESFYLPRETINVHETNILNYFTNRSTNASAESFNAKLKGVRALLRGVTDKKFFLFRIAKLYG